MTDEEKLEFFQSLPEDEQRRLAGQFSEVLREQRTPPPVLYKIPEWSMDAARRRARRPTLHLRERELFG